MSQIIVGNANATTARRYVVLVSGRGSNLSAILAASKPEQCAAVISNRADAGALEIARTQGIATAVVPHQDYATRNLFDSALADVVARYTPDLVVMAGFMRILGEQFINRFEGHMINIHPSLLPAFPGVRTHARALEAGVRTHGCTVHLVTSELDAGPIIAQTSVPVLAGDDVAALSARVLVEEHRLYPRVVQDWLAGKLDQRLRELAAREC